MIAIMRQTIIGINCMILRVKSVYDSAQRTTDYKAKVCQLMLIHFTDVGQ